VIVSNTEFEKGRCRLMTRKKACSGRGLGRYKYDGCTAGTCVQADIEQLNVNTDSRQLPELTEARASAGSEWTL
jgi:hypothetical protein